MLSLFIPLVNCIAFERLIPIEYFTDPVSARSIRISPDGKHLAIVFNKKGEDFLAIVESESKKNIGVFGVKGKKNSIDKVYWTSNKRVVYSVTESYFSHRGKHSNGELFGVNIDGSENRLIFGYRTGMPNRKGGIREAEFGNHVIINKLKEDEKHILIAFYPWKETAKAWFYDSKAKTTIYKLNVFNGRKEKIDILPIPASSALTDESGIVRFAYGFDDNLNRLVSYRLNRKSKWIPFKPNNIPSKDLSPIAFSKDNQNVYLTAVEENGTTALFLYNFETRISKLLFHDESVDIGYMNFNENRNKIISVATEETYPEYKYIDNKNFIAVIHKKLIHSFKGYDVIISDWSDNGKHFVMYKYSDYSPPEYYVFETDDLAKGSYVLNSRPKIKPHLMSITESIDIKTRDGEKIHGYLTLPNEKVQKDLPLVVLPHGGPHGVRDYWGFNWEVQLLASRGYAVLQVNFRGSGGFGNKFEEAGFGEWGKRMQDDVTDATRKLIDDGIVAEDRICIFGSSYGGYAALMGTIKEPELYQCAIGMMGVYDLSLMFEKGDVADTERGLNYLAKVLGKNSLELSKRSPVSNVEKITANLLLIHGKKDRRAPIEHAINLMNALDLVDKPYQWLEIWNEGHGFGNSKNRKKTYSKILSFLDENIGSK